MKSIKISEVIVFSLVVWIAGALCGFALLARADVAGVDACVESAVDEHANQVCIEVFGAVPGAVAKASLRMHREHGVVEFSGCQVDRAQGVSRLHRCESHKNTHPGLEVVWRTGEMRIVVRGIAGENDGLPLSDRNPFLGKLAVRALASAPPQDGARVCYRQAESCGKESVIDAYTCFIETPDRKFKIARFIPNGPSGLDGKEDLVDAGKPLSARDYGFYLKKEVNSYGGRVETVYVRESVPLFEDRTQVPSRVTLSLASWTGVSGPSWVEALFREERPSGAKAPDAKTAHYPAEYAEDPDRYCVSAIPAPVPVLTAVANSESRLTGGVD